MYLIDHPLHKPDLSVPLNMCEKFHCVFKSQFGAHSLLYGAEIDAVSSEELITDTLIGKSYELIELKTVGYNNNFYSKLNAEKVLLWWSQIYLVGIDKVVCGLKKGKMVTTIKEYPIHTLPEFSNVS